MFNSVVQMRFQRMFKMCSRPMWRLAAWQAMFFAYKV